MKQEGIMATKLITIGMIALALSVSGCRKNPDDRFAQAVTAFTAP